MLVRSAIALVVLAVTLPAFAQTGERRWSKRLGPSAVVAQTMTTTKHRLQTMRLRVRLQRESVATASARAGECRRNAAAIEAARPARTRMATYRDCIARG